jgi:hypothetical protein
MATNMKRCGNRKVTVMMANCLYEENASRVASSPGRFTISGDLSPQKVG